MSASQRKASPAEKSKRRRSTVQPVGQGPTSLLDSADPLLLQRAIADPAVAPPDSILALQRSYGNWAVSSLVQAKLTVGPVGDRYEREADRIADQVMASGSRESGIGGAGVQRQELEKEELQARPLATTITPLVQRQELDEEELQAKPQSPVIQRQEDDEKEFRLPVAQRGYRDDGTRYP